TVIAYEQPVWFIKGQPPETFTVTQPFTLLIADSGVASPTRETVAAVRRAWQKEPERYERLFDAMGEIARAARRAIERGDPAALGPLMQENQRLLRAIGVSTPRLEQLIAGALEASAAGAKLSGGGGGGNIIALVEPATTEEVRAALEKAGAARVLTTVVG
ncbi:MAG: mevalonate kinase, partial [Caldilineae bacterium]